MYFFSFKLKSRQKSVPSIIMEYLWNAPGVMLFFYRPPSARNRTIHFSLHDEEENKPGGEQQPSKAALKQKKKREARKAKKQEEGDESPVNNAPAVVSNVKVTLTGDPEKDKKIKNIKKVGLFYRGHEYSGLLLKWICC